MSDNENFKRVMRGLSDAEAMVNEMPTKAKRGFAAMDPALQRELAKRGGSSVPADKRSFSQSSELARTAGSKGGANSKGGGRPKKDNG